MTDGNVWLGIEGGYLERRTPDAKSTAFPVPASGAKPGLGRLLAGHDGKVWFSHDGTATPGVAAPIYVGSATAAGAITLFPVASEWRPGNFAWGGDGAIWYTAYQNGGPRGVLVRMTLSGSVHVFPLDAPASDIAAGPGGTLWLTSYDHDWVARVVY